MALIRAEIHKAKVWNKIERKFKYSIMLFYFQRHIYEPRPECNPGTESLLSSSPREEVRTPNLALRMLTAGNFYQTIHSQGRLIFILLYLHDTCLDLYRFSELWIKLNYTG